MSGDSVFVRLCRVTAWLILGPLLAASAAAALPDWVRAALSEEAKAWQPKQAACVLYLDVHHEFVTADRVQIRTRGVVHARSEAGLQNLRTSLPYDSSKHRVDTVRAWYISSKGKTTELRRRDYTDQSASTDNRLWNARRVLLLNYAGKADVGACLAWEHVVEEPLVRSAVAWRFDPALCLFAGKFSASAPAGHSLAAHSFHPQFLSSLSGQSSRRTLELPIARQIAPGTQRPPSFVLTPLSIELRCVADTDPNLMDAPRREWSAFSEMWTPLFEEHAQVTPEIEAAAQVAIAGKETRWQRLEALASLVQKKVAYLAVTEDVDIFAGYRPNLAKEVLRAGLGDCKDKTTLLKALALSIGERSVPILVNASHALAVDPTWPAPSFNHVYLGFPADADVPPHWFTVETPDGRRYVVFDPTHRTLPFGAMPVADIERHVLILDGANGELVRISDQTGGKPSVAVQLEMELKADGTARSAYLQELRGARANEMRANFEGKTRAAIGQQLEAIARGRFGTAEKVEGEYQWDDSVFSTKIQLTCDTPSPLRAAGAQQLFIPRFAEILPELTPWKTTYPGRVNLPPLVLDDRIRLRLPAGASPKELPADISVEHQGIQLSVTYRFEDGAVVAHQKVVRPAAIYTQSDYEAARQVLERFSQARRMPVVIEMPAKLN